LRIYRRDARQQFYCQQTLLHPREIQALAVLNNGDIVTGSNDGILRVWTADPKRRADDKTLLAYKLALEKSVKPTLVDPLKQPSWETRKEVPGQEGAMKMFRINTREVWQCEFKNGEWIKFGDILNVKIHEKKKMGDKYYDEILQLDIDMGKGAVALGFNYTDDPQAVARDFAMKHSLPDGYRTQILEFVRNHQEQKGYHYADLQEAKKKATRLPTFGSFPIKLSMMYGKANMDGLWKKLLEFNALVPAGVQLDAEKELPAVQALVEVLASTSNYHVSKLPAAGVALLTTKLLKWPSENVFVAIDLVRIVYTHPEAAQAVAALEPIVHIALASDNSRVQKLALRAIVNAFGAAGICRIVTATDGFVQALLKLAGVHCSKANKFHRQYAATLLHNLAFALHAILGTGPADPRPSAKTLVRDTLSLCLQVSKLAIEAEDAVSASRAMVAAGTLIMSPKLRGFLHGLRELEEFKAASLTYVLPESMASVRSVVWPELQQSTTTLA